MPALKPLGKRAATVFKVLRQGCAKPGDARKINNNPSFMAVHVEVVGSSPQGQPIVSVTHYYEQNGDLMSDPDVTFLVVRDETVIPLSFRQDSMGIDRVYVRWEGQQMRVHYRMQNDLAAFCNQWMENIRQQQFGGKLPQEAVSDG